MSDKGDNFSEPSVSVIMTTYNEEKFIEDAISAILKQTLADFELIIVDDGSKDRTVELISSFEDPRIYLIERDHRGHYSALNTALKNVKGQFIAKVDPDDIPREDRLEVQANFLKKHPNVGVVGSSYKAINKIRNEKYIRKVPTEDSEIKKELTKYIPVPHSSMMFRSSVISDVGLYNHRLDYLGEVDLLLRIGQKYKLANIEDPLITREIRPDSSFHQAFSDLNRRTALFKYNLKAVSLFGLPRRFYVFPFLSLLYKFLPKELKKSARKHFSKLTETY